MPSIALARAANGAVSLLGKKALIVGGTSGIGEATALRLASLKADVTIVGRSQAAATKILDKMKASHPEGIFEFYPIDLTLLREVRRFTTEFASKQNKLNYLVLTAGVLNFHGRSPTEEGHTQQMVLSYYSRFLTIHKLLPLLESTAASGEDVRVLDVLAAGKGGYVDKDDLALVTKYSAYRCALVTSQYTDLMVDELSRRHPTVTFAHLAPGIVKTPLANQMPWYLSPAKHLLNLFATTSEDFGEIMAFILTSPTTKGGFKLLGSRGEDVRPTKYHTPETRQLVYQHSLELTGLTKQ
mmetsp:Transcript_46584/g.76054  ORF Transcript_46584/g.76054 Transcript_46584/m.76054 type:complete len:298 (+) Transcript_46584:117-1010(+)